MFLDQIERKLAALKREQDMQKDDAAETKKRVAADRAPGSKVVAIDVDPELYAQLQTIAKRHGLRGVRPALLLAAKAGLRHLT